MEKWKAINDKYEVSTLGNVRRIGSDKLKALYENNSGYFTVYVGKNELVHRLVARAFIPNPDYKREVNHKNGIKTDNTVSNLEWVTRSENLTHRYTELGQHGANYGRVLSTEWREKISKSGRGISKSPEWRQKMSELQKGKPHPHKGGYTTGKGRKLSEEHKRKISEARKAYYQKIRREETA